MHIWVPDTRRTGFAAKCRRQCLALRKDGAESNTLQWLLIRKVGSEVWRHSYDRAPRVAVDQVRCALRLAPLVFVRPARWYKEQRPGMGQEFVDLAMYRAEAQLAENAGRANLIKLVGVVS